MSKYKLDTGFVVSYEFSDGRKVKRSFMTLYSAMSRLAWWMIFDKYPHKYETLEGHFLLGGDDFVKDVDILVPDGGRLSQLCDCDINYMCWIHNRKTGYLKRLHDRLTKFMLYRLNYYS